MPCKFHLSGHTTFYNVSEYQHSEKPHLNKTEFAKDSKGNIKLDRFGFPIELKKRRFYKIKSLHRKKILSSAKFMHLIKKQNETAVFFTLTFPGPTEDNLNGQFNPYYNDEISSFLDYWTNKGIQKTKLRGYIWTKELTENLQIHYHVIALVKSKIPSGIVKELNRIWGNYTGFHSNNGFRVGKKGIILKNIDQSIKYASKYAGKSQKGIEKFPSPAYRISNSMKIEPKKLLEFENDAEIEEMYFNFNRLFLSEWADIGIVNEKTIEKYFNL